MTRLLLGIDDGVATVMLNDPASSNALSTEMVRELEAMLADLATRSDVSVLLLQGAGDTFCAGAPRALLLELAAQQKEPADIRLADAMLSFPLPVVAAMRGHAVGGGLALGLCADAICMARESRYGMPFMTMGFTPGMGSTRLLEHVLTPAVANELLYTGELRRGAAFIGCAGINHVVPASEVDACALDVARRIAANPRASLRLLKRTLSLRRRIAFHESHLAESLMHSITFAGGGALAQIEAEYVG